MLRLLGHKCGQQPDAKGARRDYISREDLSFFLEGEAAARAMRVLDTDGDGRVSLAEMRDAVIAIYRERKNLAFTLKARRPRPGSALPHAYCSRMQHRHPACSPFLLSAAQAPLYAINALLVSGVRQLLALSAQHASGGACADGQCRPSARGGRAGHAHGRGQGGAHLRVRAAHRLALLLPPHLQCAGPCRGRAAIGAPVTDVCYCKQAVLALFHARVHESFCGTQHSSPWPLLGKASWHRSGASPAGGPGAQQRRATRAAQVDVSQVWLAISSCLVGFVFVFGNNIRNLYESVIFLFIVHPCARPPAPCRPA